MHCIKSIVTKVFFVQPLSSIHIDRDTKATAISLSGPIGTERTDKANKGNRNNRNDDPDSSDNKDDYFSGIVLHVHESMG